LSTSSGLRFLLEKFKAGTELIAMALSAGGWGVRETQVLRKNAKEKLGDIKLGWVISVSREPSATSRDLFLSRLSVLARV